MRCRCGHGEELHTRGERCGVQLDAYPEHELPAWSCPCVGFSALAASAYSWDAGTSSWQAVA